MFVVMQRHWRGYRPGRVLDMPDGAAHVLIRRGVAAPQEPPREVAAPQEPPREEKPKPARRARKGKR